jgi:hypothetical protein
MRTKAAELFAGVTVYRRAGVVGSRRWKLVLLAATALAAVPGFAHASTLPPGDDPIYSNHVEANFDGTPVGDKFDSTATGGLAVIGNPDPNPTSSFWASATNNNYAIPSLYASVRSTGNVSGLADSSLEYFVEFSSPVAGSIGITVQASAQATAAVDDAAAPPVNSIASAFLHIQDRFANRLVDISARSDLISALGTQTISFDDIVSFQYNVLYTVVMDASAQAAFDHSAVAMVDPYFDLSDLPDGVTFEISNGIGNALPNATPIPAALPLFASGLGALGLLGWRRKKKAAALAV